METAGALSRSSSGAAMALTEKSAATKAVENFILLVGVESELKRFQEFVWA